MENRNKLSSEAFISPERSLEDPPHWKKRRPFNWKEGGEELIPDPEKQKPFILKEERDRIDRILSFLLLPHVMKGYPKDIVDFFRDLQKRNAEGTLDLDAEYKQIEKDYFDVSKKHWSEKAMGFGGIKLSFLRDFLDPSYNPETTDKDLGIS